MKYIDKQKEPDSFVQWKEEQKQTPNLNWISFPSDRKRELLSALLRDQGYICCYCGMGVKEETNRHVEHIKPKGKKKYKDFELDYQNLLASCGRETKPGMPRHCGHKKGDWYKENLFVSPLSIRCENRFLFKDNGEIVPAHTNDKAAKVTIKKLGLDINDLNEMRGGAIEGILEGLDLSNVDRVNELISRLKEMDDGQFRPFCFALIQVLKRQIVEI